MNAWTRQSLRAALALTLALGGVRAAESAHVPLVCGISYRGPERQKELQGIDDLPATLRELAERQIRERVGNQYVGSVAFDRGQLINLDVKPMYNLLYEFRLSATKSIWACILLSPNGDVVQGLSLPAWAHDAAPPRVVTLADATDIAGKHGMSESKEVELRYFPDTDTLEWLFSKTTRERGPSLWGKTLHIPVQDSAGVHWSKWEAIR